ncbi:hypothetical protein DOY81_013707, partial [Sarcophaga bullata]
MNNLQFFRVENFDINVSLTPTSHAVLKCDMLQQQIVYNTYTFTLIVLIFLFTWDSIQFFRGLILNEKK